MDNSLKTSPNGNFQAAPSVLPIAVRNHLNRSKYDFKKMMKSIERQRSTKGINFGSMVAPVELYKSCGEEMAHVSPVNQGTLKDDSQLVSLHRQMHPLLHRCTHIPFHTDKQRTVKVHSTHDWRRLTGCSLRVAVTETFAGTLHDDLRGSDLHSVVR
jgi:hypothetical protein